MLWLACCVLQEAFQCCACDMEWRAHLRFFFLCKPLLLFCCRETDLEVNPVREKKLTNVRAAGADDKVFLAPPRLMTLEDAIG